MNTIDLHMHTNISKDGQFTPEELIQLCFDKGLRTVAIADHDSTRAVPAAQKIAQTLGMTLIPAVELDCHLDGTNLHVLGYGINPLDQAFHQYEQFIVEQEQAGSAVRLQAIRALGIEINEEQIQAHAVDGVITGEMIAEVVLQDPKNNRHPLLMPYREGGNRSVNPFVNFYWDFCSQGKSAYAPVTLKTLAEAVSMIKAAGGIAVLAHPAVNIGKNTQTFREIVSAGICGVEAYSSYHDADTTRFYIDQGQKENVLITVGSDFHGRTKPSIQLGTYSIPEEKQIQQAFMDRLHPISA